MRKKQKTTLKKSEKNPQNKIHIRMSGKTSQQEMMHFESVNFI